MNETIGRDFMRLTRLDQLPASPQSRGEPQPLLELPLATNAPVISLPKGREWSEIPPANLLDMIEQRTSVRKYAKQPLSLMELSFLLWTTQGVKALVARPATQRTVPSAGARHAFETFILANRVQGLQPGLYRFAAIQHAVQPVDLTGGLAERLAKACFNQKMVSEAAATFFWVAVAERMTWRYVQRGYRYLHLDAGHACQNLYLAAEAIDCGVCAIAAFDDAALNAELKLDGEEQFVIYLAALGKKPAA